ALAALHGRTTIVRALMAKGANVNVTDQTAQTPLMLAAAGGHLDVARALIEGGARLEVKDKSGMTALLAAASAGRTDVLRLLVASGASVEARDLKSRRRFSLRPLAATLARSASCSTVGRVRRRPTRRGA